MSGNSQSEMLETLLDQRSQLEGEAELKLLTEKRLSEFFGLAYALRNEEDRALARQKFWKLIQEWGK